MAKKYQTSASCHRTYGHQRGRASTASGTSQMTYCGDQTLFLITNKVWSPQYVIWLVPLAVLARPRWWPYVLWQLAEVWYFFAIWGYLIVVSVGPGHAV